MAEQVVIETEELTKVYKDQVAVDHLTFNIAEGEIFGFLGPNGAGKTTTLLMLLGLTEPSSGKARVLGLNPMREPIKIKRNVGYLQENMGFYRDLNAWYATVGDENTCFSVGNFQITLVLSALMQ